MTKGQVSTEYLVILAVVLVIALVVVFLVSQGSSVGAGVTQTQSQNYWNSQTPFSVTNTKVSGTTLQMEVVNRDSSDVTLTAVDVDSANKTFAVVSSVFTTGESQTVNVTNALASSCTSGGKFSVDMTFTYTKGSLPGLKQDGKTNLVGVCS